MHNLTHASDPAARILRGSDVSLADRSSVAEVAQCRTN